MEGGGLNGLGHDTMADPNVALPTLLFQHRQSNIFQFFGLSEFLPLQIHVAFNQRKSFSVVLTILLMFMATNVIIIVNQVYNANQTTHYTYTYYIMNSVK